MCHVIPISVYVLPFPFLPFHTPHPVLWDCTQILLKHETFLLLRTPWDVMWRTNSMNSISTASSPYSGALNCSSFLPCPGWWSLCPQWACVPPFYLTTLPCAKRQWRTLHLKKWRERPLRRKTSSQAIYLTSREASGPEVSSFVCWTWAAVKECVFHTLCTWKE